MVLTHNQISSYEHHGFLIYGPILSEKDLKDLRQRIDQLASGEHPTAGKIGVR